MAQQIVLEDSRFEEFQTPAFSYTAERTVREFADAFPSVSVAMIEKPPESTGKPIILFGMISEDPETWLSRAYMGSSQDADQMLLAVASTPIFVFDHTDHCLLTEPRDESGHSHLATSIDLLASRLGNMLEYCTVTHHMLRLQSGLALEDLVSLHMHHNNNRLGVIMLDSMSLADRVSGKGETQDSAVLEIITNIGSTAQQLLDDSRELRGVLHFRTYQVISLAEIIESLALFARFIRISSLSTFSVSADCSEYRTCGIAKMILATLLQNSKEALIKRGAEEPRISLTVSVEPGSGLVSFTVTDDGVGMSLQAKERLFSPFMSSKGPDRGLGLYVSKRLADSLGGSLSLVYSEPLRGTQFVLTLPCER